MSLDITTLDITTPESMRALGARLAAQLPRSEDPFVITIEGELGAGKTTLVAGLLGALGVRGAIRSPTYTLIEPYEAAGLQLYHLDLYRLAHPNELEALGVRDLLLPGAVLLIEWPSRAQGCLPASDLALQIDYVADALQARRVSLQPGSPAGSRLIANVLAASPE